MQSLINRLQLPSPEQSITWPWNNPNKVDVWMKRDDCIHPIISGNKWRKLKYALSDIEQRNIHTVISFGGGYSNHIHALAYCCHQLNLACKLIIRGDYSQHLTPTLEDCIAWGAELHFVDRKTYRLRDDANYLNTLIQQTPNAMIIPEGGSQAQAIQGTQEIIRELQQQYDYVLAPVGSGGTLAGLIAGSHALNTRIHGIAVLKGKDYLETLVTALYPQASHDNSWTIHHDFHHGGYAKSSSQLLDDINIFKQHTGIATDPVYSGKLISAAKHLIGQGTFPIRSRLLLLHTGGLQGARSE
ncbi:pyridoxal-phosphate dependent enzyme [Aestuariibacter sp. AA17]|uniref:Pyridoxal-phosphate dependent enzyme n=1 Tax=Fluctibacter corallii TaxID=2984329 RepID=A0ABT3A4A4_9ALTE|nr:pyridoxal-phosphate dependent enzyme [Aestuariibacter sp. AA17]MCV2883518.1 pyridoxal-phosphate dependent enzyme [Aestuariibacter sp. AA17]